ncbi:MAG: phosphatase PAP2 family protein [Candidatus Nitrosotenuis sp.]|nr:MAG: phosphatase PAP2 family protein [Candidatus Nitrosotenuis sp.]
MQNWLFDVRSRAFLLFVLAFIIMSVLVQAHVTSGYDRSILLYFQSAAGNRAVDLFMWGITEVGSVTSILLLSIILAIIRRTRRIGITLLLCIVIGTLASGYFKGYVIDSPRPDLEFLGSNLPYAIGKDTFVIGTDGSFPSGHATRAAIVAFVLGYALSERFPRGRYLIWLFPIFESISRVYVLQHYPMDVFGGTVFGIIIANLVSKKVKLDEFFKKPQV